MSGAEEIWVQRKNYELRGEYFRFVWENYLKFYTVFLTLNVAGIGLTLQHVPPGLSRWVITAAFLAQNLLSGGTAYGVGRYSKEASGLLEEQGRLLTGSGTLVGGAPFPTALACYAAKANLVSHFALGLICAFIPFIPSVPQE